MEKYMDTSKILYDSRLTASVGQWSEAWAKDTGDLVSNTEVINKIKNDFSEPYIVGQNDYAIFTKIAKNINGKLKQADDQAIEGLFREAVNAYKDSEKTKEQALADFRKQAADEIGL